jgi:acetyl-CoA C-acetyltransferase
LASAAAAKKLGLAPLARLTGQAGAGIEPKWIMMAPELAVKKLLAKTGAKIADFDLVEVNEAFSSAAVALTRVLELDPAKTNVNGGAVALGHPIGCTGARILTTLVHALKDRGGKKGLAALCIGGGNAVAVSVEMM